MDPLGLGVGNVSTPDTAVEEQEVAAGTFGAMAARFDGKVGAFSYLLFVLLYFPCVAAMGAVYRETNWDGWPLWVSGPPALAMPPPPSSTSWAPSPITLVSPWAGCGTGRGDDGDLCLASSQQDRRWSVSVPAPLVAARLSRCDSQRPVAPSERAACGVPRSDGGCPGRFRPQP